MTPSDILYLLADTVVWWRPYALMVCAVVFILALYVGLAVLFDE